MRIQIYQINTERDRNNQKFMSIKDGQKVDASIYDEVFDGELYEEDLESIFTRFNTEGHPLHRGHSMSVSDVITVKDEAYICQSIGFKKIDFDKDLTQKPDNLMRVVYVEPNRPPFVAEVQHTLEAEQRAVKGFIEIAYFDDNDACIVCNEEAKLIGMEGNRRIGDGTSIIAGPFFVCGTTEDDFRGLTDEEVTRYMDRFMEPEDITQAEVENDTGCTIIYGM